MGVVIPKVAATHRAPQNLESPVEERAFLGSSCGSWRLPLGPRRLGLRGIRVG